MTLKTYLILIVNLIARSRLLSRSIGQEQQFKEQDGQVDGEGGHPLCQGFLESLLTQSYNFFYRIFLILIFSFLFFSYLIDISILFF